MDVAERVWACTGQEGWEPLLTHRHLPLLLASSFHFSLARTTQNAESAETREEDDERGEAGKHQSLQFFLLGRQQGLCVEKMPSAFPFKETSAIWPSFRFEKSHHFNVTTKPLQILCFTFFAHRSVAGYRQHSQRAVLQRPFSPGLEN